MSLSIEYLGDNRTSVYLISVRNTWNIIELTNAISRVITSINEIPKITDLILDFSHAANTYFSAYPPKPNNIKSHSRSDNFRYLFIISTFNFPEKISQLFKTIFPEYTVTFVKSFEEAIFIINTDNHGH